MYEAVIWETQYLLGATDGVSEADLAAIRTGMKPSRFAALIRGNYYSDKQFKKAIIGVYDDQTDIYQWAVRVPVQYSVDGRQQAALTIGLRMDRDIYVKLGGIPFPVLHLAEFHIKQYKDIGLQFEADPKLIKEFDQGRLAPTSLLRADLNPLNVDFSEIKNHDHFSELQLAEILDIITKASLGSRPKLVVPNISDDDDRITILSDILALLPARLASQLSVSSYAIKDLRKTSTFDIVVTPNRASGKGFPIMGVKNKEVSELREKPFDHWTNAYAKLFATRGLAAVRALYSQSQQESHKEFPDSPTQLEQTYYASLREGDSIAVLANKLQLASYNDMLSHFEEVRALPAREVDSLLQKVEADSNDAKIIATIANHYSGGLQAPFYSKPPLAHLSDALIIYRANEVIQDAHTFIAVAAHRTQLLKTWLRRDAGHEIEYAVGESDDILEEMLEWSTSDETLFTEAVAFITRGSEQFIKTTKKPLDVGIALGLLFRVWNRMKAHPQSNRFARSRAGGALKQLVNDTVKEAVR